MMIIPFLEMDGEKAQRNKLFALTLLCKLVTHVGYEARSRD